MSYKYYDNIPLKDCHEYKLENGIKVIRCPHCKDHGVGIDTRGDCKNLIKSEQGEITQCYCYAKEHK